MHVTPQRVFDVDAFLRSVEAGKAVVTYRRTNVIFTHGDACDRVFYIKRAP